MSEYILTTNNRRLYEFYKKNTNLNFESMSLVFIDFLEQINQDLTKTLQNTVQHELLQSVHSLQNEMTTLNQSISSYNNNIIVKFHEINKEFLDSMKLVIDNAMNTNTDKLNTNMDKMTEIFLSKLINFMPTNNKSLQKEITHLVKSAQEQICELVKTQNPSKVEEYIKSFDQKLKISQEPLFQYVKLNHEQLKGQLSTMRESSVVAQSNQDKLFHELNDFLNKFKSSSSMKGQYSENAVESVLTKIFPMASVLNTSSQKAMGDFILHRNNMLPILIENKNYETNVSNEEVKKFLRDIREQNCNGLMLSQYSGIVNKSNFFIEIHDGHVLVYVHNVDYDPQKIKTAVEIIDHMSSKLKDFYVNEQKGFTIEKEVLDCINSEFQNFLTQKDILVSTVRDFQKKIVCQIDDLKMPELHTYLSGKYACVQNNEFVCQTCGESFAKKNQLASHMKKHKTRPVVQSS